MGADDKKLQISLKKLQCNNIPGIEEVNRGCLCLCVCVSQDRVYSLNFVFSQSQVNIIKEDGMVIHFNNPKVQATVQANTFAISGNCETKSVGELLPGEIQILDDFQNVGHFNFQTKI